MPAEQSADVQRQPTREFAPFFFIVGLSIWTVCSFQVGRVWERVWSSGFEHLQPLARLCESGTQLANATPHLVVSSPDGSGSQPLGAVLIVKHGRRALLREEYASLQLQIERVLGMAVLAIDDRGAAQPLVMKPIPPKKGPRPARVFKTNRF